MLAPAGSQKARASHTLDASDVWQLNTPTNVFDASGLLWRDGKLLVISDKTPLLYQIHFGGDGSSADVKFYSDCFAPLLTNAPVDPEGLAQDEAGRVYLVSERGRTVFRSTPDLNEIEQLRVDWSSVSNYFSADRNASFEGIAVGDGKLFLANERQQERIIVVDLATLEVVKNFAVRPDGNHLFLHYSDLCWHGGKLFVLVRHSRTILEVDPDTEAVVAEYSFAAIEKRPDVEYHSMFNTGTMEGLAVTDDSFWLVTDNNNRPRKRFPKDKRPTLIRCARPDR